MELPIQITFRDMESSDAIAQAIRDRAAKLDEFHDRITSCHVVVETPHRHHHKGQVHQVKIHLTLPGHELTIDREPNLDTHADVYVSIRDAFDAAVRQLRELSSKQSHH